MTHPDPRVQELAEAFAQVQRESQTLHDPYGDEPDEQCGWDVPIKAFDRLAAAIQAFSGTPPTAAAVRAYVDARLLEALAPFAKMGRAKRELLGHRPDDRIEERAADAEIEAIIRVGDYRRAAEVYQLFSTPTEDATS